MALSQLQKINIAHAFLIFPLLIIYALMNAGVIHENEGERAAHMLAFDWALVGVASVGMAYHLYRYGNPKP